MFEPIHKTYKIDMSTIAVSIYPSKTYRSKPFIKKTTYRHQNKMISSHKTVREKDYIISVAVYTYNISDDRKQQLINNHLVDKYTQRLRKLLQKSFRY